VKRVLLAGLATALLIPGLGWSAQAPEKAPEKPPEVRPTRTAPPAPPVALEALWAAYVRADRTGDTENARRVFQEIRRLRVERNIESLPVVGLALVGQGFERLKKGEHDSAEELFRSAVALAPRQPDGHFALAKVAASQGPAGPLRAARQTLAGVLAPLSTAEGQLRVAGLFAPVLLLAAFLTTVVFASTMVIRQGTLLLYDLRETLGVGRSRSVGLAFFAALLLLPVATFQGWGWLPFWWLAVLFLYLRPVEKAIALALVVGAIGIGPLIDWLEKGTETARNPLFWSSVAAVESGADGRSVGQLEAAFKQDPSDRDLLFLLASMYRKAGRYEEVANLYRDALRADPQLGIAINNLANLDFARGDFPAAIGRYNQAIAAAPPPRALATHYYNLSLAHLQRFEMQPADEALSQAKRLDAGLISHYDSLWKYDNGNYAVVDLGLDLDQVLEKFDGRAQGVATKNVYRGGTAPVEGASWARSALTRFAGFFGVFALVALALWLWRGRSVTTLRCLKCGAAFDRRSDRNAAAVGLCTQCYHLFVVRDGISAPARNKKLLEVQGEEERRGRIFRALSILSPGAGQLFGQKALLGIGLTFLWYVTISALVLTSRDPLSDAPSALARPWGLGAAALVLLAVFVAANRVGPDFDVLVPVRRGTTRKGRTA
jgi:tetratricopeptide (TPR) repeat protein